MVKSRRVFFIFITFGCKLMCFISIFKIYLIIITSLLFWSIFVIFFYFRASFLFSMSLQCIKDPFVPQFSQKKIQFFFSFILHYSQPLFLVILATFFMIFFCLQTFKYLIIKTWFCYFKIFSLLFSFSFLIFFLYFLVKGFDFISFHSLSSGFGKNFSLFLCFLQMKNAKTTKNYYLNINYYS